MTIPPEDVAAEAERRAPAPSGDTGPLAASDEDVRDRLTRWAFIEVDAEDVVRSTRRAGAPITAFKRLLSRLLRQYHIEQNSQMTRFNLEMLGYVERLERRLEELERRSPPGSGTDR